MNNLFQFRLLSTEVVIAGGGLDGMAAGLALRRLGRTIRLVERSVVMEEMLHLNLATNLLNVVGGMPPLASADPTGQPLPQYPVGLRRGAEGSGIRLLQTDGDVRSLILRPSYGSSSPRSYTYRGPEGEFRDHRSSHTSQSKKNSKYDE
jgi:hypothetical protein